MKVYQYKALKDNYNWILICEKNSICAGIDIYDSDSFIEYVKKNNLKPIAILNTHHHNDHIGGNNEVKRYFPDIKVYASKYDMEHKRIECQTDFLIEGDKIYIGEIELSVLDIVGHTLGHICYFNKEIAFVGDTIFSSGCGRLFEGSPEQMFNSLEKLVKNLELSAKIYCGHEYTLENLRFCLSLNNKYFKNYFDEIEELRIKNEFTVPTNLEKELIFNPFLMVMNQDLKEILGLKNYNSLEAFTLLREKKNHF